MKYFTTALVALASAAFAAAQSSECNGINCFNNPPGGWQTSAGSTVNLSWNATTQGTVSLQLRSGNAAYLSNGSYIAQGIPNSGSYTWNVPKDIVRGSSYAIEIIDDSDPTKVNYTPQFNIDSTVLYASTSGASASSGASSTTLLVTSSGSTGVVSSTVTGSLTTTTGSASTTGSTTGSQSGSQTSATAASQTSTRATISSGSASRATAVAGLIGAVAFGALAL